MRSFFHPRGDGPPSRRSLAGEIPWAYELGVWRFGLFLFSLLLLLGVGVAERAAGDLLGKDLPGAFRLRPVEDGHYEVVILGARHRFAATLTLGELRPGDARLFLGPPRWRLPLPTRIPLTRVETVVKGVNRVKEGAGAMGKFFSRWLRKSRNFHPDVEY